MESGDVKHVASVRLLFAVRGPFRQQPRAAVIDCREVEEQRLALDLAPEPIARFIEGGGNNVFVSKSACCNDYASAAVVHVSGTTSASEIASGPHIMFLPPSTASEYFNSVGCRGSMDHHGLLKAAPHAREWRRILVEHHKQTLGCLLEGKYVKYH